MSRSTRSRFLGVLFVLALVAALWASPAGAASLTWDANGVGDGQPDGPGAWLDANQWWSGSANATWTSGDDANFGNGGVGGAVTLASPTVVNSLTLNSFTGTYTLGTAGQAITLNTGITMNSGAGAATIISPVTLGGAQSWTNNSAGLLTVGTDAVVNGANLLTIGGSGNTTITSVIGSGAGGITKNDGGTLTLTGANTYTGATTVNAGTLQLGNGTVNGTVTSGLYQLTAGGTTLYINNATATPALTGGWATQVRGSGTLRLNSAQAVNGTANWGPNSATATPFDSGFTGTLQLDKGRMDSSPAGLGGITNIVINSGAQFLAWTGTYTQNFTLAGNGWGEAGFDGALRTAGSSNATYSGSITLAADAGFNSQDTSTVMTISGGISGGFGISKVGTGPLTLTGTNTYGGATTITTGTLQIKGSASLPATSAVSLGSATLQYLDDGAGNNGTISRTGNDITLSVASTTDTINVGNNGSANTGNTVAFGALNNGTPANAFSSTINFTGSNGYLQSYSSLGLSGLTGGNTTLNPTTTSVTILGAVTNQESGVVTAHFDTLTLDGTSTGNAINGVISDNAGYVSVGNGDTRLTKSNTSTWTLNGTNTYSGVTTISAGVLRITNGSALGSTTSGTTQSGTSALEIDGTGGAVVVGAEALSINGGGITNLGALRNIAGDNTYGGTVTMAAQSRINSDSGTLTLNNATAVTGAAQNLVIGGAGNITISGAITTTTGFVSKADGVGTLTLSGVNTYTGATTVSAGTLVISGSPTGNGPINVNAGTLVISGSPTGNSAINVNGGTLQLDYTTNSTTSKINDLAILTLGGGTVDLKGGSYTEVVASTTLTAGTASRVTRSSDTSVLQMGAITPGAGAAINFGADSIATTTTANVNSILGPWATVGDKWAANDGSGSIVAYAGPYTDIDAQGGGANPNIVDGAGTNVRILNDGVSGAIGLSAATTTVNTLLQSNADFAATIDTAGKTLAVGGVMIGAGKEAVTVGALAGDGTLNVATAGGSLMLINNNAAKTLTVNAVIADNTSASALTAVGNVLLNGVNTYTGLTSVGSGTLEIGGAGQLNSGNYAGAVTMGTGATLKYTSSADQTLYGAITGTGSLVKDTGAGTLTLTGANTYSGGTTVSTGTLIAQTTALTTTSLGTGAASIGGGATLQLNNLQITGTTAIGNAFTGSGLLKVIFASNTTARNTTMTGVGSFGGTIELAVAGTTGDKWNISGINAPSASVQVDSGAQLYLNTTASLFNSVSITGTGNSETRGAIRLASTLAAPVSLAGDATIGTEGGTISGNITSGASGTQTLTLGTTNSTGNATLSGNIGGGTGTIALTKTQAGMVTLSGNNTFTGGVTLSAGTLNVNSASALGTGTFTIAAGTFDNSTAADIAMTANNAQAWNANFTFTGTKSLDMGTGAVTMSAARTVTVSGNTLTIGGAVGGTGLNALNITKAGNGTLALTAPVTLLGNQTATVNAGTMAIGGAISDGGNAYSLTKAGAGRLVLSGNNVAATGGMSINAGAVQFESPAAINGAGRNVTVNSAGTVVFGVAFETGTDIPTALSGRIVASSQGAIAADNYAATNFDFATPGLTAASLGAVGSVTYTGTLTPNGTTYRLGGGGGTLTMANANAVTGAGNSLVVVGPGTVVLSAANNYDGTTTIQSGVLQPNDAAALGSGGDITFTGGTLQYTAASAGQDWGARIENSTGAVNLDTNAQTVTLAGVIDGSNTGGLGKLGAGSLILDGANTYTGVTTISAGTLQLGTGATTGTLSTSSVISNNSNLTINRSNAVAQGTDFSGAGISGSGSFTQAGTGTTTLNVANTFSGVTTVSAGVLSLTHALAIQNSALDTTGAGTVTLSGVTTPTFGGLANSGTTRNLATVIPTGYTGVTNLTLNPSGTVTYGGVISNGAAGMTLTKTGAGTQVLQGANTYTGATILRAGTLNLSGTGSILNSAITLAGGGLTLTYADSDAEKALDRVSNTAVVTSNGGTITYTTTTAASARVFAETLGSVALTSGQLNIVETLNKTAGSQTLTLAGLTRTGAANTSAVTFSAAGTAPQASGNKNMIKVTGGGTTTAGQIIGPWATTGTTAALQTDYAVYNADYVTGRATAATANDSTWSTAWAATSNYNFANTTLGTTLTATRNINTLRHTGGAETLTVATSANLGTLGILNGVASALTIAATGTGAVTLPTTAADKLYVNAGSAAITISAPIKDNTGALTLVKTGGGQLTLTGASNFSGGLTIASGQLNTQGPLASGSDFAVGSGLITIRPGAILQLSRNTLANAFDVTDGTIQTGNSFGSVVSGNIVVTGTATLMHNNGSGNIAYTGNISGPGGVLSLGTREDSQLGVTLSGTNTFAGPATVGTNANIRFNSRVSLPNTGSWTADNLVVEAGGAAYFMVGGTGQFDANDINILKTLGTAAAGFKNGSYLGLENAAAFAYNGVTNIIADTNGGANKLGFKKFGGGELTLGSSNTYTGPTYLHAGTTVVSSLNSVVGGTASSSLGAPKTVTDGTIVLNPYGPTITLKYTGPGETTDRMFNTKGSNLILDQSGSGPLKFTGNMAGSNNTATFTLQGSTAGTAEFAGTIGGTTASKIVKSGTGTWTLSGNNAYTGGVTINAGTLQLGNAGALNSTAGLENAVVFGASSTGTLALAGNSVTVANLQTNATPGTTYVQNANGSAVANATLTVGNSTNASGTFAGTIQDGAGGGTLALTKAGTGTLTLSGASTYTGATLVSGGRLQLDGSAAGTLTSGLTVGAGATLGFTAVTASTLDLTGKPFSLGGTVALDIGAAGVNDALTVGNFTLTGNSAFTFNPIGGIISGATYTLLTSANPIVTGGFSITGQVAGRLTIAPTINANTVTITPVLDEGIWNKPGSGNWSDGDPGATGGNWTNYKPTVAGDAALFGSAIAGPATITVDAAHSVGWLRFDNTNAYTIGATDSSNLTIDNGAYGAAVVAVTSGSHIIAENVALASSVTVAPASGTTLTVSGNLSGAGGVSLSDAGKLVLSGDNTYTGATTITAGTLQLDGNTAAGSTVAVGTAGTLTGSGIAKGNATITGAGVIDFSSTGRIVGTLGVTGGNWNGEGSVGGKITTTAGVFTIPEGATLNVGDLLTGGSSLEVTGTSTTTIAGTLNAEPTHAVRVYLNGTVTVTGTMNTSGDYNVVASNPAGSNGTTSRIILEGSGQWNHPHAIDDGIDFVLGEAGNVRGELIVRDSAKLNTSFIRMGTWDPGTWGVVIQDGGTVTLAPTMADYLKWQEPALGLTYKGQAEYHLNGGVLNCGVLNGPALWASWGYGSANGQGRFYFNGGTLVPNTDDFVPGSAVALVMWQTSYMQGLTQVIVQAGGAKIDTDGHKITIAQNLEHDPNAGAPAIDGGLTKLGLGTLILHGAGDSTYTGPTAVNAGTLAARNAGALKASAGVTVASGAGLEYRAAADAPLAIGGTLTVNSGAGTAIGASIGVDANSAAINVTGDATITDAAHAVNIHLVPGVAHATGLVTLVHADGAGSSLNPATAPTVGAVYNNTDFTVGSFTRSKTDIQVDIVPATPLTGAYWTGGLAGNTNVWCVSNGATASNWVTAAGGGATGLVPGAGADVVISADSVATAPTATVLGADMAIKTLTISDTANGLGVSGDDYALTITPTDPGTGITVASGVPASTIGSNVVLGAAQTWTNNSANALTVSGPISGTVGLTKAGEGTLILSGDNPYTGDTTVSAGTLKLPYEWAVQNSTVIMGGGTAAVVFDSAETANAFWFGGLAGSGSGAGYDIALQNNDPNTLAIALTVGSNNANTAYAGLLSGGGRLTKTGAGTLTLSNAASTYAGATNIAAGTLIVSKLADGNSPSSIGQSTNVSTNLLLGNGTTLKYVGAGDSTDRQFRFNGNLAGLSVTLDASGSEPINFTSATGPSHSNANQTRTLNLIGSNTGDNTLAANIGNNGTGVLSVVKSGEGTWVLSGTNTYTGATTVSGGKLLIEGDQSLATGAVTIADVATLGGNGVIGGAVTVNGTLAPGTAGIGMLTVGTGAAPKNVTMAATAIYNFDITSPTNADTVDIMGTGIATFATGWQVVLSNGGGGAPLAGDKYYLFSYDAIANATTLVTPAFSAGTTGWIVTGASIDKNGTGIYITGITSNMPGDTNGDKVVDAADYIAIKTNFGLTGAGITRLQGDLIDNDIVDWADLQELMNAMATRTVPGAPAVPEPATLGLLAIGALAVIRRRRMA